MDQYKEQLLRITHKLNQVKAGDLTFRNFGADEHEYEFNPPIDRNEVIAFEQLHHIQLPPDYVAFITTLGNGGPGQYGGAGPFYGIYELGEWGYMVGNKDTLTFPCLVNSKLTAQQWTEYTAFDQQEEINKDAEYYRKYDALFGGLLPIGTQGCSFQTMLILNGDYRGRVVNIDQDLQLPQVAKEENFLDWYEQWLDSLI